MALVEKQLELLSNKIKAAYEEGTTVDDAEKLAAEFLYAQIMVSDAIKTTALNTHMRKAGVKAIKAAVYLSEVQKSDKKPSDVLLSAIVDSNDMVASEETSYFESLENKESLERYYNIFREAHLYFRGISKGRFE